MHKRMFRLPTAFNANATNYTAPIRDQILLQMCICDMKLKECVHVYYINLYFYIIFNSFFLCVSYLQYCCISLFHVCVYLLYPFCCIIKIMPLPPWGRGIKRCFCLTSVCLMSDICLCVSRTWGLTREQRGPGRLKLAKR